MEALECIRTRRSLRKYLKKEVSEKEITAILEAGMLAPSAHHEEPWHFIVVRDREALQRVSKFHQWIGMAREAPVGILVCADPKLQRSGDEFWPQDVSAATQNVLLAVHALGLGAVWTGVYPIQDLMKKFRKEFGIPESIVPFAFIPIGFPAERAGSAERFKKERAHNEKW